MSYIRGMDNSQGCGQAIPVDVPNESPRERMDRQLQNDVISQTLGNLGSAERFAHEGYRVFRGMDQPALAEAMAAASTGARDLIREIETAAGWPHSG